MHALVLAAGLGTRLRPLTDNIAKPALPFLGKPLLSYSLKHLIDAGLSNLTINTHYHPDTVKAAVREVVGENPEFKYQFSDEQPNILGSGGAVSFARPHLENPDGFFAYANGDEVMVFPEGQGLKPMIDFHRLHGGLATMLLMPHPEVLKKFNGVWIRERNEVVRFGKDDLSDGSTPYHFTGVMILSNRIFDYLPAPGVVSNILHDGLMVGKAAGEKFYGYVQQDLLWYETGDPESFAAAESALKRARAVFSV